MANAEHLEILRRGVEAWNQWRRNNPTIRPDLTEADFTDADLAGAYLSGADLNRADLSRADLTGAYLNRADLTGAYLSGANVTWAYLMQADLTEADLYAADLTGAYLNRTDLTGADLTEADLTGADLTGADLTGADLSRADLTGVQLVESTIENARLSDAKVYGISAWNLQGTPKSQADLVITRYDEAVVTVDDLKVAEFMYLLLSNPNIRDVIDTITSKVVLILGRFTKPRKRVLDELRNQLRSRGLSPVVFDFEIPTNRDMTDTVRLLAGMARFVIADLTDPATIPYELGSFVPDILVPVRPIILASQQPPHGFKDLKKRHPWLLDPYPYESLESLLENLEAEVIDPADAKREELNG